MISLFSVFIGVLIAVSGILLMLFFGSIQRKLYSAITQGQPSLPEMHPAPGALVVASVFQSIIDSSDDAIISKSLDGIIKTWNHGAGEIFGFTASEAIGQHISIIIPKALQQEETQIIDKIRKGEYVKHYATTRTRKDGTTIHVSISVSPIIGPDGTIVGASKIARDISEELRERVERTKLEHRLEKAYALARIGSWELDLASREVSWSAITREIHEVSEYYQPGLESGINFYKEGEGRILVAKKVTAALEQGLPWDMELQIVTGAGNEKWIRTIGEVEFVDGKCVRAYGSFQDIDKQKKAEVALKKTIQELADYKFALDVSSIIAITDSKGVISYVNNNFCKISKYSREELIGNTHRIINSGYHPKSFFTQLWNCISAGEVWRGEICNKASDGSIYWEHSTIVPFTDGNKTPFRYLAIRFNITEKKLAEVAALDLLREKNTILESIGDAFFAVNKDWVVTYWNTQAQKIFDIPASDILGKQLPEFFDVFKKSHSLNLNSEAMRNETSVHAEDFFAITNKWLDINAYPSQGGLSVYCRDISARKAVEFRLAKLNEDLQKKAQQLAVSNTELEQFAYVASHDLQEPLRMITSFLSQLETHYSHVLDGKGQRYIDFATDGARRMRQIILDLLEYSRVGRFQTVVEPVDLNDLVNELEILFRKQIEEQAATISYENLPVVLSHKAALRQVMQNLLSNALKYSRKNVPAMISIQVAESTEWWKISVTDNGIGIAKEYFEKIFIIFQRLHSQAVYAGTGLGLAITKKIVESFGGNITISSEEGRGSTFSFTIKKTNHEQTRHTTQ